MEESTSREKILKRVRNALISKLDNPYPNVEFESPVYTQLDDTLDVAFAQEFTKVAGKFIYCSNEIEFIENLKILISENNWDNIFCLDEKIQSLLSNGGIAFKSSEKDFLDINVGITGCEYLIARLGSVMVSSGQKSGRRLNVYPETHIVMAYTSQLVPDLKDALKKIKKKYKNKLPSMISVITGPSRTADIEKTLVMGAQGPENMYVFLIQDDELTAN